METSTAHEMSKSHSLLEVMIKKYHGNDKKKNGTALLELKTDIFGNYCRLETPEAIA